MKAAILGTTNYHETMQQIVKDVLQRQAGYLPPVIPVTTGIKLPVLCEAYGEAADVIVETILGDHLINRCNPRSPYLWLTWILIGSDNPYHVTRYVRNIQLHRHIALQYIWITVGGVFKPELLQRVWGDEAIGSRHVPERIADVVLGGIIHRYYIEITVKHAMNAITNFVARGEHNFPSYYQSGFNQANREVEDAINDTRQTVRECLVRRMQQWMYLSDDELLPVIRQLMLDIMKGKA